MYLCARFSLYAYLALKASLTRFPINHISTFEKVVIYSLAIMVVPYFTLGIWSTQAVYIPGAGCLTFKPEWMLPLSLATNSFWNFSCLALFNIPLTLHARSTKRDNQALKQMLLLNFFGCIAVVVMYSLSMLVLVFSKSKNPAMGTVIPLDLLVSATVAWHQTRKKHPNEASTTAEPQSAHSAAEPAVSKIKKMEMVSSKLVPAVSASPLIPEQQPVLGDESHHNLPEATTPPSGINFLHLGDESVKSHQVL